MAALTIKFNYVQDYAVLYREDFIKYVGTILPKTIKRDHVNDVIVRCKRTASDPSNYLTDRYDRAIRMEKHNKALISGLTLSAAWWLFFAYKNDVPVNLAAYQKCIDELNAVSPYNKSFS